MVLSMSMGVVCHFLDLVFFWKVFACLVYFYKSSISLGV
jgi:hypothetical protein